MNRPKHNLKVGDWCRILYGTNVPRQVVGLMCQVIDTQFYIVVRFPKRHNKDIHYFHPNELMYVHNGVVEYHSEKWGIPKGLK